MYKLFFQLMIVIFISTACISNPSDKSQSGNFEIIVTPLEVDGQPIFPSVYINGKFIGNASKNKPVLYLNKGKHEIKVEAKGFKAYQQTIQILGAQSMQIITVELEK